MSAVEFFTFIEQHLLAIIAILITLVFIYHYVIEKEHTLKLTRKYRNNILESQSKTFLNATRYLLSGSKNLAIKEFTNALDLSRDTIDTYFALGSLYRSNGEIEKAIGVHRSIIAKENVNESTRLAALKELALDFDKGGFVNKAIDTYKDVLKINRDQDQIVQALCNIYENIEDWDMAYNYRVMLSKVGQHNQAQTISHILTEKAKSHFNKAEFSMAKEDLDDAFRFAPSVSAKILKIKLLLIEKNLDESKNLLVELLDENTMYANLIFQTLEQNKEAVGVPYIKKLDELFDFFLELDNKDLANSASVVLSKTQLLRKRDENQKAYDLLAPWYNENKDHSDVMKSEYIKLLIELGQSDLAMQEMKSFLGSFDKGLTKHFCSQCGFKSDDVFWRCPQCHNWETIQFRWKA